MSIHISILFSPSIFHYFPSLHLYLSLLPSNSICLSDLRKSLTLSLHHSFFPLLPRPLIIEEIHPVTSLPRPPSLFIALSSSLLTKHGLKKIIADFHYARQHMEFSLPHSLLSVKVFIVRKPPLIQALHLFCSILAHTIYNNKSLSPFSFSHPHFSLSHSISPI